MFPVQEDALRKENPAMSIGIETIPNKRGRDTVLMRRYWRNGKKVEKETLLTLTDFPAEVIQGFDAVLRGGAAFRSLSDAIQVRRALPHGHIAAALFTARRIGLENILHRKRSRMRDLAMAAAVARLTAPGSKLDTARRLSSSTADSSLGHLLDLGEVTGNEMLSMLDWLLKRRRWIERSLARRYLNDGTLILYDVSSSCLEGRCCPLAAFGHNRDGKKGKAQINYGLLCAADGCPIAIEVFAGNVSDPSAAASRIAKIQERFGIARVALAGDRGMITSARIQENLRPLGLDWISALRTQDIRRLLRSSTPPLNPETQAADAVAEMTSPDFPGERLLVCMNPRLREERARKREDLLRAAEAVLGQIAASVRSGRLKGKEGIGRRIGRDADRKKVGKHFNLEISDTSFSWSRAENRIAAEAALDGICVVRTSLNADALEADAAVDACKRLSRVERAFRTMKQTRLKIRPVCAYSENRVRAHAFLCMLAYHLEYQMRQRLAPILFEDDDKVGARARRKSPAGPAKVSESAERKTAAKRTADGLPAHSVTTLLADLATLTLNHVVISECPSIPFQLLAEPTPLQAKAMELLEINPAKTVPSARAT